MTPTKPRLLNMEEKRKLEKLLVQDIETAEQTFREVSRTKRDTLIKKLTANPTSEVKALFALYQKSRKAMHEAEEKIEASGWQVRGYNEKELAINDGNNRPQQLADFDAKTNSLKEKLAALKRSYTIKLFAAGAEAQTLFEALGKDIKALTA